MSKAAEQLEALKKAVAAVEPPRKLPVPVEEPKDPWKDPTLIALCDRFEQEALMEREIGLGIMKLQEALSHAKLGQRLTQKRLENVRSDIDHRLMQLGLDTPPRYHERSCDCEDCRPVGTRHHNISCECDLCTSAQEEHA
jgi:hypothetical protein